MRMRMHELAERSGLPRTTIHHYLREGLLPEARKTAPNAAEYGQAHLERLELIGRLRAAESGELSIPEIRKVIAHVEAGVAPTVAVRLVEEDVEPVGDARVSPAGLADSVGIPAEFVHALVRAGILRLEADEKCSAADLLVVRACHAICEERGIEPADLAPLADLIREVGNYSATLVEVHAVRSGRRDGAPDGSPHGAAESTAGALRGALASLCDALLWRAFSDAQPGDA